MSINTESGAWWDTARAAFFTDAAEAAPEPAAPTAEDVPLSEWAENREALGLGDYDGSGDFVNLGADQSGLPDWRHPVEVEQPELTDLGRYAEERAAAGIRTASAIFGAAPAQPRVNTSPWSI